MRRAPLDHVLSEIYAEAAIPPPSPDASAGISDWANLQMLQERYPSIRRLWGSRGCIEFWQFEHSFKSRGGIWAPISHSSSWWRTRPPDDIHGSKGLQFRVVYVGQIRRKASSEPVPRSPILLHRRSTSGCRSPIPERAASLSCWHLRAWAMS